MVYGQKFQDFQTLPLCHPFIRQIAEVPEWEMSGFDYAFDSSWGESLLGRLTENTREIDQGNKSSKRVREEWGDMGICISLGTLKTSHAGILG